MLSGWAYGAIYRDSDERTAALEGWRWHYNCQPGEWRREKSGDGLTVEVA